MYTNFPNLPVKSRIFPYGVAVDTTRQVITGNNKCWSTKGLYISSMGIGFTGSKTTPLLSFIDLTGGMVQASGSVKFELQPR